MATRQAEALTPGCRFEMDDGTVGEVIRVSASTVPGLVRIDMLTHHGTGTTQTYRLVSPDREYRLVTQ